MVGTALCFHGSQFQDHLFEPGIHGNHSGVLGNDRECLKQVTMVVCVWKIEMKKTAYLATVV